MSRSKRSTRPSSASAAGFTVLELLLAVSLTLIAVATTSSFFTMGRRVMRDQSLEIETTQAARAAIDVLVRDLRLGGACLPVTGEFMSLEAVNGGGEDEVVTRTGLTRPDLSCVRTATPVDTLTLAAGSTIQVESVEGFSTGMRAYIRGPVDGEFFNVTSVDTSNNRLGRDRAFGKDYPGGSGVFAIDERHFYIHHWAAPWGDTPELMMQIGDQQAQSFAVGIEQLNVEYELNRNCPSCDVVDNPNGDEEWRLVEQIFLTVTARSDRKNQNDQYYRRTVRVGVKPRNLLPQ